MNIGYARVSTKDQNLEIQISGLQKYGCETIYQEKKSGKDANRTELKKMISSLRSSDKVVVMKLDRLGRSLKDLVNILNIFKGLDIEFVSIGDSIDTSTIQGRLLFNIMASFAEFERELISDRTKLGLASAKARGKLGGRPKGPSKENQKVALSMYRYIQQNPESSIKEVREHFGAKGKPVPIQSYYNWTKWAENEIKKLSKKRAKN